MVVSVALLSFVAAARFQLFERVDGWIHAHESLDLDELVVVAAALGLLLVVFSWRRTREARRELRGRIAAEQRLRDSEERYRRLSEAATEAVVVHEKGVILEVNPRFEEMFGVAASEAVGSSVLDFAAPESRDDVAAHVLAGDEEPYEAKGLRRDGVMIDALITGKKTIYQGRAARVSTLLDLSALKGAERQLREAEALYRNLIEQIPAVTYIESPGEGDHVVYISPQVEAVLGYPVSDWLEDPTLWNRLVHPDDRAVVHEADVRTDETGEPFSLDYRMIAKGGRAVWIHDGAALVTGEDGCPLAWQGMLFDITERKLLEADRRRLLGHLVQAQEDERMRLASNIHDDSVQVMTAVGLRLGTLRRAISDPKQLERLEQLQVSVTQSIARLRHLLFDLRPPALDREGLAAALGQLILQGQEEEEQLEMVLENRLVEEPPIEIRTIAYRIVQEALANVRKHAGARRAAIALEPRGGGLFVRIRDDGRGFDEADAESSEPGHLGLSTMRERAELAGGWWRIMKATEGGSSVEFWLPIDGRGFAVAGPGEQPDESGSR